MRRLIFCLMTGLLISASSFAQQSLVGTYKLVSMAVEIDNQPPRELKQQRGYVILTPTRWMYFATMENRKFGTSVEEKAALWDTLTAYSGPYVVEGNKITVSVDVSWNQTWNGTQVVRYWKSEGNRLFMTTERMPHPRDPSKTHLAHAVFEKVE